MAGEFQIRRLGSPEQNVGCSADSLVCGDGDYGHGEIPSFDGGGEGPPGLVSPVPQRSGAQVGGGWFEQFADAPDVLKSAPEQTTIVRAGGVAIGGSEFVTMAGPCSGETERRRSGWLRRARGCCAAGHLSRGVRRMLSRDLDLRD